VALGQVFSPSTSVFPPSISLQGKMEKTNHHRFAQQTSRLRCVCCICCWALHHTKRNQDQSYILLKKSSLLSFEYKLCESCIIRTDSIKDLAVCMESKLNFHYYHVDRIFPQVISCWFNSDCNVILFFLGEPFGVVFYVRSELGYASSMDVHYFY
jgi:hypothetical protein